MRPSFVLIVVASVLAMSAMACAAEPTLNHYQREVFVANHDRYRPTLAKDTRFVNAWGLAIRPAGAGGHFWVTAKDVSYEYVGDVRQSPNPKLRTLHQDALKEITLPLGGADRYSTATVYSDSADEFVITQTLKDSSTINAPAKFLFSSDGGVISAWTERKRPDGTFDRADYANAVIDWRGKGSQFFGLALSEDYSHLYVADFGKQPAIHVFDGNFKPVALSFDNPFDENHNGKVDAGEYAPFNVQTLRTPQGDSHVFVTYAKTRACTKAAVKQRQCKVGEIFPGEEDVSRPGNGRLAEFTEDGALVHVWPDAELSAPWGVAYAPDGFGALSGALLVGNFGSGEIVAYDAATHEFMDVMRDSKGKKMVIPGLWALLFGNGQSLGDLNALYYAAGPRDEKDGIFGAIRYLDTTTQRKP